MTVNSVPISWAATLHLFHPSSSFLPVPLTLSSTTYPMSGAPPSCVGFVHPRVIDVFELSVTFKFPTGPGGPAKKKEQV